MAAASMNSAPRLDDSARSATTTSWPTSISAFTVTWPTRPLLPVGEIATALTMDKSTVSRLLASLRTAGYVRQRTDRRYRLTSKLLFLACNFIPGEHLRDVARDSALKLHSTFSEAVHVAAVDGGEVVFVDYRESPHAVRTQLPTIPAPLHLTAIGRAVLSRMTSSARASALEESARAAGSRLVDIDTL